MQGDHTSIDLAAHREIQHRLRKELRFQAFFNDYRFPKSAKLGIRKPPHPLDTLRSIEILILHRSQLLHRRSLRIACVARVNMFQEKCRT